MDPNALVMEQLDAGADLIRRFSTKMPVKVAFWLKPTNAAQWYLYIASEKIDDRTLDEGYREVLRLARQNPSPYLGPFQVKLIPGDDPQARTALNVQSWYPGSLATRIDGHPFNESTTEGVYIYPTSTATPTP